MTKELKPCPFCGSPSVGIYEAKPGEFYVICRADNDCRGAGRQYGSRERVIANWNYRAADDAMRKAARSLQEASIAIGLLHHLGADEEVCLDAIAEIGVTLEEIDPYWEAAPAPKWTQKELDAADKEAEKWNAIQWD